MPELLENPDYQLPKSQAEREGGDEPVQIPLVTDSMLRWLWRWVRGK